MGLSVPKVKNVLSGLGIEIGSLFYETLIIIPVIVREAKKSNFKRGNGQTILIFPGFISGDWAVYFLKIVLNLLGYNAYTWGQGINHGKFVELEDGLTDMVNYLYDKHDMPIIFIGWSKGARIALKMAKKMIKKGKPRKVAGIITIGGPIRPDGRYSLDDIPAWLSFFKSFNEWVHNIVTELQTAAPLPPKDTPTTIITYGSDMLVSKKASTIPQRYLAKNQKNVFIKGCGHLAAGFSIRTIVEIVKHINENLRLYDKSHHTHFAS